VCLFEMPVVEREQMLDLLARRQVHREQALARVARQLREHVHAAEHDLEPHELVRDEARDRDVADRECDQ